MSQTEVLRREAFWKRIILIVSLLVVGAVGFLLMAPRLTSPAPSSARSLAIDVSFLPTVNASLNAVTTGLLLAAFVSIRRRRVVVHRRLMLAAFATSAAFMVSYLLYHSFKGGPRPYLGAWRGLYLSVLLSHIVLAALIVPMALLTLYRGWTMQKVRHTKLARVTLLVWLYVSVSGVAIYYMLYVSNP